MTNGFAEITDEIRQADARLNLKAARIRLGQFNRGLLPGDWREYATDVINKRKKLREIEK